MPVSTIAACSGVWSHDGAPQPAEDFLPPAACRPTRPRGGAAFLAAAAWDRPGRRARSFLDAGSEPLALREQRGPGGACRSGPQLRRPPRAHPTDFAFWNSNQQEQQPPPQPQGQPQGQGYQQYPPPPGSGAPPNGQGGNMPPQGGYPQGPQPQGSGYPPQGGGNQQPGGYQQQGNYQQQGAPPQQPQGGYQQQGANSQQQGGWNQQQGGNQQQGSWNQQQGNTQQGGANQQQGQSAPAQEPPPAEKSEDAPGGERGAGRAGRHGQLAAGLAAAGALPVVGMMAYYFFCRSPPEPSGGSSASEISESDGHTSC